MSETFEEWRVTGTPTDEPYEFVWSRDLAPWLLTPDAETAARNFVAMVEQSNRPGWVDGPHLSKRTVTITAWEAQR